MGSGFKSVSIRVWGPKKSMITSFKRVTFFKSNAAFCSEGENDE